MLDQVKDMTTNQIMRMAMACVSSAIRENNSDSPDSSCSGVANLSLYQAIDALVAERDALKAALEQVTESLDRLGDQSDGEVSPRVWTKYECQARIDAARAALKGKT